MAEELDPRGFNFTPSAGRPPGATGPFGTLGRNPASDPSAPAPPPARGGSGASAAPASPPTGTQPGGAAPPDVPLFPPPPGEGGTDPWDWTRQYASTGRKPRQPAGGGDASLEEQADPELAAMYVKPEKVQKVHNPNLTYSISREQKPFPWKWTFLLVILAGLLFCVGYLFLGGGDGGAQTLEERIRQSPAGVIWRKINGEKTASDPNYEAYMATTFAIQNAYSKAMEFAQKKGSFPVSISDMTKEKIMTDEESRDGWGTKFSIIAHEEKIVSWGMDKTMNTADDITCTGAGLNVPPLYSDLDLGKKDQY